MIQYLLTGLAGIAIGIVIMRVWQARETPVGVGEPAAEGKAAAPATEESKGAQAMSPSRKLLVGTGLLVSIAAAVLAFRGDQTSAPTGAASALPGGNTQSLDDVDTMIARLAKRLETDSNDGEGFRMLGWSYVMTGKPDKALAPFKRALELLPDNALVHSGYGEALVGVAGGKVTDEAKTEFAKALKLDPKEPRSRYFSAMWLAQHGQEKQALYQWIELANSGPADAPWQADVQRQISDTAKKLGIDVTGRLKVAAPAASALPVGILPPPDPAAAQAIGAMPKADQEATINQMVEGLAAKLKANPRNPDGWVKLLRSRMVLDQRDHAAKDLVSARKALADDPAGLAQVNAVAKEIGIPGA